MIFKTLVLFFYLFSQVFHFYAPVSVVGKHFSVPLSIACFRFHKDSYLFSCAYKRYFNITFFVTVKFAYAPKSSKSSETEEHLSWNFTVNSFFNS